MSPFVDDRGGAPANEWWRCPNSPPCAHPGLLHDIEEYGDLRPTCCVEGCTCGHPQNPKA